MGDSITSASRDPFTLFAFHFHRKWIGKLCLVWTLLWGELSRQQTCSAAVFWLIRYVWFPVSDSKPLHQLSLHTDTGIHYILLQYCFLSLTEGHIVGTDVNAASHLEKHRCIYHLQCSNVPDSFAGATSTIAAFHASLKQLFHWQPNMSTVLNHCTTLKKMRLHALTEEPINLQGGWN